MNRVDYVLKRRTGNAAVIYVDLDNFKPINDTFGHEAGDAVLKAAGERLLASLRPSDTAARLGGDEFAVLLVDIPEEHIGVVADRIVGNLTKPLEFDGRELEVGASLGVASAASGVARRGLAGAQRRRRDVRRQARRQGPPQRLRARRRLEPRDPLDQPVELRGLVVVVHRRAHEALDPAVAEVEPAVGAG